MFGEKPLSHQEFSESSTEMGYLSDSESQMVRSTCHQEIDKSNHEVKSNQCGGDDCAWRRFIQANH